MKRFFTTLFVLLVGFGAKAQLFIIPYFTGTTFFGSYGVTVTSAGSVSSGGALVCLAPTADQYWIGPGGVGDYVYTMSKKIYQISIHAWGINGGVLGSGEYMSMFVNGVPYPLTPANMLTYTECSAGGGPCYLWTGELMGPVGLTSNYNGADFIISSCTGINSFECYTDGILSGVAYSVYLDTLPPNCIVAVNNGPCLNDTLKLDMEGDSSGATYFWTGPGGFTSTLQNPFIYPATYADTGTYTCIRSDSSLLDTSSTYVMVYPHPVLVLTNNAPLCAGLVDTLRMYAGPDSSGETFAWTGPNAFIDSVENPIRTAFNALDTGWYTVIATTVHGCSDTALTHVGIVPPPLAPVISGVSSYCQGVPFVPFTVSYDTAGTVYWYTSGFGGVGTTIPSGVNTSIPGIYTVYAGQTIGSCESPHDSFTVRVTTTPPAPAVSGTMQYCQFIGPFTPLLVTTTHTGTALWYTAAVGGTPSLTEPNINLNLAGTYNSWVSQTDSGCEGPRTPVSIIVHPKPAPPAPTSQGPYCQYALVSAVAATPSEAGDALTWFGPGLPPTGSSLAPIPQVNIPKIDSFHVCETSPYGCISDTVTDTVRVWPKPAAPIAVDTTYCQMAHAVPLNYQVDSLPNSRLNWYQLAVEMPTPTPSTANPGTTTWYVSQTVRICQSDSVPVMATILYLPKFDIATASPWICEKDSIWLSYQGPVLQQAAYLWKLPVGDSFAHGTGADSLLPASKNSDSLIYVKFDSAANPTSIVLRTSDYNGRCYTWDTVKLQVIPQPTASTYTNADVCLGDTTSLQLSNRSGNAVNFTWTVDFANSLLTSPALNVISASSNSGGPFSISWVDTGLHVILINAYSEQGCASEPIYDTVHVHEVPDASFKLQLLPNTLCLEDSVLFVANAGKTAGGYNYSYTWSPAHSFSNINEPSAWGRVEEATTVITLTVKDPFGCTATSSTELEPGSCCTVAFPNAFTPNGDGHNDYFYPLYTGYHNFHVFRIANRWGQTVYETTNSDMKWDGTYNGVPQDMGVYFYYIKYDCGSKTIEESGDVTLIR